MSWRRIIPVRVGIPVLFAALCLVGLNGEVARAGKYHVFSCRTPDGGVAPTDGWSGSETGAADYVDDECKKAGALVAALSEGAPHEVGSDRATWAFAAPSGTTISSASLWRAGDADGGWSTNATYEFWIAGPENNDISTDVFDECVGEFGCPTGVGSTTETKASSNLVLIPPEYLDINIYVNASCGGSPKFSCPSNKGDSNGYAAVVYLYAADLTLEQTSQPTVTSIEGELATSPTLSGTADLSLHAEDTGSGVYEAVFSVDGTRTGSVLLDENGGHCRNVGQTTDGLPAFLYLRPCQASISADVPFDTTGLTDGSHHLVVSVTDAAGNSTVALDRRALVSNHPASSTSEQPPTPEKPSSTERLPPLGVSDGSKGPGNQGLASPSSQMSAVNGTNASGAARLDAHWGSTAKATSTGSYGHSQTIVGRLASADGSPIGNAVIQVQETPEYESAKDRVLTSVHAAVDGTFSLKLPSNTPSSRITLAYSSHVGQATPDAIATLRLAVDAKLKMKVTPRTAHAGQRIAFTGTLLGAPLPPGGKQLVLEARAPGGTWRQFQVLATRKHGRFKATYRFRLSGPVTYAFRAVSRKEADFPYATGASNTVRVHER
jgi:hypothetical protein